MSGRNRRRALRAFGVIALFVMTSGCPGSAALFLAGGITSFIRTGDFATSFLPSFAQTGDTRRSGRRDVVVVSTGDDNVSILVNNTPANSDAVDLAMRVDVSLGAGTDPMSVALADLNGDGALDLATANAGTDNVSLLRNLSGVGAAAPSFTAAGTLVPGADPVSIAAADLNGDGLVDLVTADAGPDAVSVFINATVDPGTLTFTGPTAFPVNLDPVSVAVADFNTDGRPDIVVAARGADRVSVLFNQTPFGPGVPVFSTSADFATADAPVSVATGDVNADGRADIIVANSGSSSVSVLLNATAAGAPAASFAPKVDTTVGAQPSGVVAVDLDGDGLVDLAVSNAADDTVTTLTNTTVAGATTPTFAAPATLPAGDNPVAIVADDLNGDLLPDIASVNAGSSNVTVLVNTTAVPQSVAFGPGATFATGGAVGADAFGSALTDLNGDGRLDFIQTNDLDDSVSVFINATPAGATTATLGTAALLATASGNTPERVAVADFNGDGRNDFATTLAAPYSVAVYLSTTATNATTATFANDVGFPLNLPPQSPASDFPSIAAGDFNADGRPDIAIASCCQLNGNGVEVLLNNTAQNAATPSFRPSTTILSIGNSTTAAIQVADFNADGRPDIAALQSDLGEVRILRNTTPAGATTPTFANAGAIPTTAVAGLSVEDLAVGDVNGDGLPDLVTANFAEGSVSVLVNTTPPAGINFSANRIDLPSLDSLEVRIADVNADGLQDIVVEQNDDELAFLFNTTAAPGSLTPTFGTRLDFPAPDGDVRLGDLNGDLRPDLVVGATTLQAVVFLQR